MTLTEYVVTFNHVSHYCDKAETFTVDDLEALGGRSLENLEDVFSTLEEAEAYARKNIESEIIPALKFGRDVSDYELSAVVAHIARQIRVGETEEDAEIEDIEEVEFLAEEIISLVDKEE